MNVPTTIDAGAWLSKYLEGADGDQDLARAMLATFAEALMSAQASMQCNAAYGERTEERENSRNGYRMRPWDTRVGSVDLAVPKLRQGVYSPEFLLQPRRRAEKALVAVVYQAYVEGVSTRRVDDLVRAMGIEGISKSEVSRMAQELRPCGGRVPQPTPGCRSLSLFLDRRGHPTGARGRPGGQRDGRHRHRRQRRRAPGHRRLRHRHDRGHRRLDGLPALAGGPRVVRGGSSPMLTEASRRPSPRCWPRPPGNGVGPTSWPTWPPRWPRATGR